MLFYFNIISKRKLLLRYFNKILIKIFVFSRYEILRYLLKIETFNEIRRLKEREVQEILYLNLLSFVKSIQSHLSGTA